MPDLSQLARYVALCCSQAEDPGLDYHQGKDSGVMTLQDALVAYRTYARAEGKSPKTIIWVVSTMSKLAKIIYYCLAKGEFYRYQEKYRKPD